MYVILPIYLLISLFHCSYLRIAQGISNITHVFLAEETFSQSHLLCPDTPHSLVTLWPTHLREILPHDLDEVGHGEVHYVVSPGGLQHHVGPQQVVAGE